MVLLVTNYRPDNQHSMLRFSRLLADGLRKRDVACSETYPKERLRRIYPNGIGKWLGYADKYLAYPRQFQREMHRFRREATEKAREPVIHVVDHSNSPYLVQAKQVPSLLTCHDLIAVRSARGDFPGIKVSATGKLLQAKIRKHLGSPTHIACDSCNTQADLLEVVPKARGREEIVHLGLQEKTLSRSQRKLKADLPFDPSRTSFLLHVGNDAWYKNRKAVVEGFLTFLDKHPDDKLRLVLVGPSVNEQLLSPQHRKSLPQFADRIHVLTGLDDNDLGILYENAFAFAFPSLLEGFGWPPLEAQAHGCPVIASRAGSLDEILGNSVLSIDPARPQELCEAIERLRAHPEESQYWSKVGSNNAARFPFSKTVDRYEDIYQRLAHGEK